MKKISLRSFGPIYRGEIKFGDLTILVGPQASGKSLLDGPPGWLATPLHELFSG